MSGKAGGCVYLANPHSHARYQFVKRDFRGRETATLEPLTAASRQRGHQPHECMEWTNFRRIPYR